MRSITRLVALLAVGATLGACSRSQQVESEPVPLEMADGTLKVSRMGNRTTTDSTSAVLHVRNQNFNDFHIFAYRGTERIRIGVVSGGGESDFQLPRYLIGTASEIVFVAQRVGSRRASAGGRVVVEPGDRIELLIPPLA